MITFDCPSCQGKCQVADGMSGRKMKCPKCGTRIRHHADGTIELLTVGEKPPAPAAPSVATAPTVAAPAVPATPGAASAPPTKESSAIIAHVAHEFHKQGEGKQNLMLLWGLGGFFALAFSGIGLALWIPLLIAAPLAIYLVAALVALVLRMKRREAADQQKRDSAKTDVLPKV